MKNNFDDGMGPMGVNMHLHIGKVFKMRLQPKS